MTKFEYITRESGGAFLFPQFAYIAFVDGRDGDGDVHAYGATPEEAIDNLRDLVED